jgi:SAM-dependent methyltransferase
MPEVHEQRKVAEGFGADAARYDRARPSYPPSLAERIVASSPGQSVLDVGIGTGIAARLFRSAGCPVLGVEPDARMADLARDGGFEVEVGKFEDWDPAGRSFDVIIAAQAWHWVDPVVGAVKAAAALRQGGRLAVFWNAFQPPADLASAFASVYDSVLPTTPVNLWRRPILPAYLSMCATAADGMARAGTFGAPETWQFDWERPYTREEWLEAVPTFGGHGQLPLAVREQLLAGIGAAIDAVGGSFTMGYATVAATALRLDRAQAAG